MTRVMAVLLVLLFLPAGTVRAEDPTPFSFVVLGHVRGAPEEPTLENELLGEIAERCRRLRPDVAILTGDMIWGLPVDERPLREQVLAEWDALDRTLATIGAPVLRTPGNHDISNLETRDIYFERYGRLPHAETRGRCRLILLASCWMPGDGDTREKLNIRGEPLSDVQLDFLGKELANDRDYDHAFVFMHHMLWWDDDDDWMRRVHPALKGTKLRAVFSGDYGPAKYTHVVHDGIRYVQTSIETGQDLKALRTYPERRLLNAQMDVFARVVVDGPDVRYEMVPVGVTTTERYTPERWRFVNDRIPQTERLWFDTAAGLPRQQKLTALLLGAGFCAGVVATGVFVWWRRRRQVTVDS